MSNTIRLASVFLALSLFAVVAGCAAENEPSTKGAEAQTTSYEGVTVVGERDGQSNVRVEPKNERGESLLVLRVEGERLMIEPGADPSIVAWSGTVPADVVATRGLEDWSYIAYAYSQHLSPPALDANAGSVQPQMISAGTNGAMCIAAGSTAMQCAYYAYCSRSWCPFW